MISWFVLDHLPMSTQEVMGYVSIVVSLSFVYFGIRHFRDKENDGKVSFKKALTIGILISLITALTFGLLDVLYTEVLNPDFMDDYYGEVVETMRANLPAAELDAQLAQLEAEREQFSNPFVSFTIMSATVFIIGCIVTLLSSLILQRK